MSDIRRPAARKRLRRRAEKPVRSLVPIMRQKESPVEAGLIDRNLGRRELFKGSPPAQFFDYDQNLSNDRHAVKDYFPILRFSFRAIS
ncbi:hypothetical protein KX729_07335 [Rhizobium sp. XQZ8]|uniref:hypothetical protein n=1 Tax=Rhizobium populisoli TaxID=2859785 RepID=UPI001CA51B33|nr:hypothetical protein [Rhizobium populisoli]MBW6421250.1 hypothetical protein [Rhizobium populisoli]